MKIEIGPYTLGRGTSAVSTNLVLLSKILKDELYDLMEKWLRIIPWLNKFF